jgi:hypothetical protein
MPLLIGLVLLAFALGSLHGGSPTGSLLFGSFWLLYLVNLGPFAVLGIMVALIILIGLNWRDLGAGIGFGLARKAASRKRRSRLSLFISMFLWAIAIGILIQRPGSIFNPSRTGSTIAGQIVGGNATLPNPIQSSGIQSAVSGLVENSWFSIAFLGLLVVGGLVLVEGVRLAMKERGEMNVRELQTIQLEGLQAVRDSIGLVDNQAVDARSRIIACYQNMITTVSRLGAAVSSDLTARELERAIRLTFNLKGPATSGLTQLFEEARYSLHKIQDEDAVKAHNYLESIAGELKTSILN